MLLAVYLLYSFKIISKFLCRVAPDHLPALYLLTMISSRHGFIPTSMRLNRLDPFVMAIPGLINIPAHQFFNESAVRDDDLTRIKTHLSS